MSELSRVRPGSPGWVVHYSKSIETWFLCSPIPDLDGYYPVINSFDSYPTEEVIEAALAMKRILERD